LGAATLSMFILKNDQDIGVTAGSVDPATIQNYVDEDVLWTGMWRYPGQEATALEQPTAQMFEINVKAMRKIRADDEITLYWSCSVDNNVFMNVLLRGLVRVD